MLAKSNGLSLEQHTQELLVIADELEKAFPSIEKLFQSNEFWNYLKLSIIFHDIGKATKGFQNFMHSGKKYRFRHEILSAIIALNYTDKEVIISAVLAHHKNFEKLKELLKEYENNKKYNQDRWIEKEFEELDFLWIETFLKKYKLESKALQLYDLSQIIRKWTSKRVKREISELEKFQNIFLSASLSICDHNASAGIKNIPIIEEQHFNFLYNTKYKPHNHQEVSWQTQGNALLIAPTGQGKTESSLGWLKNQLSQRQGRAFYILPFTASINAMTKRVIKNFGCEELVGLLHGKAKFFIDEYYEKKEGQSLEELIDINKKILKPFKVVTPFQILKWAFGVKGFEKGLTELAGSYLIFDEIHIYDRDLFQRILFFIEWLIDKLQVKVFIMTATMPSFMQDHIKHILGISQEIRPSSELIRKIKRHKIKLLNTVIEEQINFIEEKLNQNKTVLVVCNSVGKAQEIYQKINCLDKVLLHSGFNGRDRTEKEKLIQKDDKNQENNKSKLLVGTQAIEVSLDIDYDLIITEPAPLDALLQRFGRVFRSRTLKEEDEANCYITTVIENVHGKIYEKELIEKSLDVLKKIEETILDENIVQEMLDAIYEPFQLDDDLRDNFKNYLDNLYPYNVYEESEEEFFGQFDGIEVLPVELEEEFRELVQNKQYIEAEKLFVSISKRKFAQKRDLIDFIGFDEYKKIIPVIKLKYSSELGLLNEEATFINGKKFFSLEL